MKVTTKASAGYQIRGMGMGNGQGFPKNMAIATVGNLSGVEETKNNSFHVRKTGNKSRKKVNYNPNEVRTALLRANRSQNANMVLTAARNKLANLLKCKGSGQYDDTSLNAAIAHARRMVRCAQMKVRNLKKEEQMEKSIREEAEREKQERAMKKRQAADRKRSRQMELTRKRRANRSLEKGKMDEADTEYKNRQLQNAQAEGTASFSEYAFISEAISLELSSQGMELSGEQPEAGVNIPTGLEGS